VIVPTYNRRALLQETLASLADQSVPADRYEVIVAVDGSKDDTLATLAALKPAFTLRWTWQENRGLAAARNTAARLAQHEVLISLDDDQVASPGLIGAHLDVHERRGDVLVQGLYPLAAGCDRTGASLVYERAHLGSLAAARDGGKASWHVWGANLSFRRQTWLAVGGFDESFRAYGGEDTDFGLRVAALGIPFVLEPRALSYHQHRVTYSAFRRQAFSEGRALVHLARKHNLTLAGLWGGPVDKPIDRVFKEAWIRSPRAIDLVGRLLTAGLVTADRLRLRPAQLTMARVIHRLYKVGGVTANGRG